MRNLLHVASLLLVLLLVATQLTGANSTPRLADYPTLKCSACHAMVDFIGDRMNETAKIKESVKVSMRFAKGDKRWVDYEGSEVRAIEIIDETCKGIEDKYRLKMDKDGLRTFSKDGSLRAAEFWTKKDKDELKDHSKQLKEYCLEVLGDHDEALGKLIQKERQLDPLATKFCKKETKLCGSSKWDKAVKKELGRKNKYEAREKKRKAKIDKLAETKKLNEEADQKKKDEAEAKHDAEEEAKEKSLLPEEEATLGSGNPASDIASKLANSDGDTLSEELADAEQKEEL